MKQALRVISVVVLLSCSWLAVLESGAARAETPEPRFEAQKIDDISIGYGVAIGDVDGDGKPDVLLADKKQFVWYRNPDWKKFVMVENLTKRDNVCLAAHDIDGDGKVEVAVGAMWNPGNTTDAKESGSVHYLIAPEDRTQKWTPVQLHNEPTVHRMRWIRGENGYRLVVLPLHGRGNRGGKGDGVKILSYEMPEDPKGEWKTTLVDESLHMTHNFDVRRRGDRPDLMIIGGREGLVGINGAGKGLRRKTPTGMESGAGEVRFGSLGTRERLLITTVEPMHGQSLVAYVISTDDTGGEWTRTVLDDTYADGHAIATADLLGIGRDAIVAGWRRPNAAKNVGVKLYAPLDDSGTKWKAYDIDVKPSGDKSGMACEDLRVADLDGDGKPDIVAAGRATKNIKIYWNRTAAKQ